MAVAGMNCISSSIVLITKVCLQMHKSPNDMKHHSSMPPNNLYFVFNLLETSWQQLKLTTSLLHLSKIDAKEIDLLLLYSHVH